MRSKIVQRILDETPKDVEIFTKKYADIVLRVHQLMKDKGYSQKDLAKKLAKKPSEVNKWLKGNHNLTLRTIAKLEAELGEDILIVPGISIRKTFTETENPVKNIDPSGFRDMEIKKTQEESPQNVA